MFHKNLIEKIRRLDAYPKTLEDFRIKTYGGAAITVLSAFLMTALFLAEFNYYLTIEIKEELLVDVSRADKLRINFDMVFPKITCAFLSVDAIDVSGEQHINIEHNIFKRRLNLNGEPIEEAKRDLSLDTKKNAKEVFLKQIDQIAESTTPSTTTTTLDPNRCESCYGAENELMKCCNSCEEVRDAYNLKGWAIKDYTTIHQCNREGVSEKINHFDKEGCQLFGHVMVNRVGGNLHISPGRSMTKHHAHIHDLSAHESNLVNLTHTVNHLSFGINIPGKTDLLDGSNQVADKGAMLFQYYVKIVPTMYVKTDGSSVQTNQFAVTRHSKQTSDSLSDSGLPGIFFIYEFAPMMVKYSEIRRSFLHFLTSMCAIVGGIFTVAGIIDSLLYHSVNALKKYELGKFS